MDEMSFLTSELEKVVLMKVVGNCLIFLPTKVYVIWLFITPTMGKLLSSVWVGLQDKF